MAVFVRKLLRIGGLPEALRTEVDAEGVLFLAEYLPVTRKFSGSVPGKKATGNFSSYVGSLVLTPQRVLGTLSSVPKLAGRTIDQRRDAAQTGAVKADISNTGLHIDVDIAEVDPKFKRPFLAELQDVDPRRRSGPTAPQIACLRRATRIRPSRCRRPRQGLTM
jgi:hypothetical protein